MHNIITLEINHSLLFFLSFLIFLIKNAIPIKKHTPPITKYAMERKVLRDPKKLEVERTSSFVAPNWFTL